MRFLLHGQLHPDVPDVLRELGHDVETLRQQNVPEVTTPAQIIQLCRTRQFELITASRDFVDAVLPTSGQREIFGRILVYLQASQDEQPEAIVRLFERYKRLTPGRLYTVTASRVKIRQLPSGPGEAFA